MTLFAGIDLGTRDVRCLIVDERGARIAVGRRSWRHLQGLVPPEERRTGLEEHDPEHVFDAIAGAIGDALAGGNPADIAAVGVVSQRSGVSFLDEAGRTVYVGANTDARGLGPGMQQQREHGELIYRIAGRSPAFLYMPARYGWFRGERPEVGASIRLALPLSDWIVHRLTGIAATEPTQAAELLVYDVTAGRYSPELLQALDVPATLLPTVGTRGEPAGEVTGDAAERFGLPAGAPVVAAGGDTQAALLAAGVVEPGHAAVVAGTTMLASHVLADPVAPEGRLWLSPHAVDGRLLAEAHCGEAGAAVDWMAALMGADAASVAREAEAGQPGGGAVAFVDPEPSAATDFPLMKRAGLTFPAPVLAIGRPRADVARAVFEGIAFGARAGLDWLAEAHGHPLSITVAGGVARSSVFVAALAGASARPVRVVTEPDASALGAAITAASKHHAGIDAAVEAMADPCTTVEPRPADGYTAHYDAWRGHLRALGTGTVKLKDIE